MSGISGVRQVRRQRPQSAYTTRRSSSSSSSSSSFSFSSSSAARKKARPTTASTRRRRRRMPSGSSTQQMCANLLESQADLYRRCNFMETKNKQLSEKCVEVNKTTEKKRRSNAVHARRNMCNASDATAQKRRQEAKRVAILEKQVLATKCRLSNMDSEMRKIKTSINFARKRRMIAIKNGTNIGKEIDKLKQDTERMLNVAHEYSGVIYEVKEEKEIHIDQEKNDNYEHHDQMNEWVKETKYYVQKSQDNIKKEMIEMDQRVQAKSLAQQKERQTRQEEMDRIKMHVHSDHDHRKHGPSHAQLQIAFNMCSPFVPTRKDLYGHDVPITQADIVQFVIRRIKETERERFAMMKDVQDITRETERHQVEAVSNDAVFKSLVFDHATKTTKNKVQMNAMNSVLYRIRSSTHRVGQERVRLQQCVMLVVQRIKEMLEQMSHPSVQKFINGSVVGGDRGNDGLAKNDKNSDGLAKNKDGKTNDQIKREKRAVMISNLTAHNLLDGFRTVESEFLQIINQHMKKMAAGFKVKLPYGPSFEKGALASSLDHSKATIRAALPRVRKSNHTQHAGSAGRTSTMDNNHQPQITAAAATTTESERFLTRQELMEGLGDNSTEKYLYKL